jgi:hypothetical protein
MSLFYPQDPTVPPCPRRLQLPLKRNSGRSSDSPALPAAFPSTRLRTVAHNGRKGSLALLTSKEQGQGHSGGPVPFSRRSLLSSYRAPELIYKHRKSTGQMSSKNVTPAARITHRPAKKDRASRLKNPAVPPEQRDGESSKFKENPLHVEFAR